MTRQVGNKCVCMRVCVCMHAAFIVATTIVSILSAGFLTHRILLRVRATPHHWRPVYLFSSLFFTAVRLTIRYSYCSGSGCFDKHSRRNVIPGSRLVASGDPHQHPHTPQHAIGWIVIQGQGKLYAGDNDEEENSADRSLTRLYW